MKFAMCLVILAILSPMIIALIYSIIDPKESFLFGRRWQFNGDAEPSETVLKINRIVSIIVLIFIAFLFVIAIIKI